MGSKKKISPFVRAISALLGVASFASIANNAAKAGSVEPDSGFVVSLLGGVIFLYAAFFGSIPWDVSSIDDGDKATMTKGKWQMFWGAVVVFLVMATVSLYEKGVFAEADLVVLGIVALLFCFVGVAIYFYVKGRSDDLG